jgi:hypothetical protein
MTHPPAEIVCKSYFAAAPPSLKLGNGKSLYERNIPLFMLRGWVNEVYKIILPTGFGCMTHPPAEIVCKSYFAAARGCPKSINKVSYPRRRVSKNLLNNIDSRFRGNDKQIKLTFETASKSLFLKIILIIC